MYTFTDFPHHFTSYSETHFRIEPNADTLFSLADLAEIQPDKIFLDGESQGESVVVEILEQLKDYPALRSLAVNWKGRTFPTALTEMPKLDHLCIINPDLLSLPNDLGRLTRLRSLFLDTTHLVGLPRNIHALKNLRELFLNTHYMESLPASFGKLSKLETFGLIIQDVYLYIDWGKRAYYLSKWKMSAAELFDLLSQLPNLKRLRLQEDTALDHDNVPELEHRIQTLAVIPESIENLQGLEEFALYSNMDMQLPLSLTDLPNLRKIWVDWRLKEQITHWFPNGKWVKVTEYWEYFDTTGGD